MKGDIVPTLNMVQQQSNFYGTGQPGAGINRIIICVLRKQTPGTFHQITLTSHTNDYRYDLYYLLLNLEERKMLFICYK